MVLLSMCAAVMVSKAQVCLDHALEDSGQVRVLSFLTSGELKCSKVDRGVSLDWHRGAVNWGENCSLSPTPFHSPDSWLHEQ